MFLASPEKNSPCHGCDKFDHRITEHNRPSHKIANENKFYLFEEKKYRYLFKGTLQIKNISVILIQKFLAK